MNLPYSFLRDVPKTITDAELIAFATTNSAIRSWFLRELRSKIITDHDGFRGRPKFNVMNFVPAIRARTSEPVRKITRIGMTRVLQSVHPISETSARNTMVELMDMGVIKREPMRMGYVYWYVPQPGDTPLKQPAATETAGASDDLGAAEGMNLDE